jgi:hypothetical protein
MRNIGIIKNVAMTTRHLAKDNRNMKPIRVSSLSALLIAAAALLLATSAHASVVDLTTSSTASGNINGALFFASDQQPSGTGFIDPFLRVQDNGNGGFEQGYNTDGGFPFNDKNPHNFQHSLLLSSLAQFDINGTEYFKFMLDSNQSGTPSNHTFTLSQLQIYTSNNGSATTTTFNPDGTLNLGTLAYNLSPGGTTNNVITTGTGSGKYDMVTYVPVSLFNLADKYVTLYFAGNGDGGFEEWTAATGVSPIPEASTFFPIVGLLAAVFSSQFVRRRQLQQLSK